METFAQRLKYARQRASMSQDELAHKVGISKASVSKIEMGLTNDVLMGTLFKMADIMQIDPRWLATGKSPMGESMIGLPGEKAVVDAWAQLPQDLRDPLRELMERAAVASKQRYWQWIEERDNRSV
jgi:transcriptional regulator with XRE-family HTH domain